MNLGQLGTIAFLSLDGVIAVVWKIFLAFSTSSIEYCSLSSQSSIRMVCSKMWTNSVNTSPPIFFASSFIVYLKHAITEDSFEELLHIMSLLFSNCIVITFICLWQLFRIKMSPCLVRIWLLSLLITNVDQFSCNQFSNYPSWKFLIGLLSF